MNNKKQAMASLENIQLLLGELGFILTPDGYYKEYGLVNGGTVKIAPIFDKGLSVDLHYDLSALEISGSEAITIQSGQPVALDRIPSEARTDVMRMLAELAPAALLPKTENFILTMICSRCKNTVSSFFNLEGTVECLHCLGYE